MLPASLAPTCALLLLAAALAGCVSPAVEAPLDTASADGMEATPTVGTVEWTGHVVLSETDAFMHTAPTEGLLWPYEQAGIIVEIPEGVTAVEVAVAWTGEGHYGIHLHSYNKDGEYIGHRSTGEQWSENPHCIRVPAADVAPGHWMIMVHSDGAVDDDFTITVLTENAEPAFVDERHGHDRGQEIIEGKERTEHEPEACTMWVPGEGMHEHEASEHAP